MGADYIEYIIADGEILPAGHEHFYAEKIVRLPGSYQVNDRKRRIGARTPTRGELGLPEGFVFCCFNNNHKITAPIFDVWMRLLRAVDGSVLWLLQDNESAEKNLRKEAAARGIDPARLVFARSADLPGDMSALMREACIVIDGRGGGKPEMAQGGGSAKDKLDSAIESAADGFRVQTGR